MLVILLGKKVYNLTKNFKKQKKLPKIHNTRMRHLLPDCPATVQDGQMCDVWAPSCSVVVVVYAMYAAECKFSCSQHMVGSKHK